MNVSKKVQVENFVQEIENKGKSNLQSSIKDDQRMSHKFDKDIISRLCQLKTKLISTRSKLIDLRSKVSNLFEVDFGAFKGKSHQKTKQTPCGKMQGYVYLSEDVRSYEKDRPWVRQGLLLEKGHIVR